MSSPAITVEQGRAYITELAGLLGLVVAFVPDQAEATLSQPNAQPGDWELRIKLAQGAEEWRWAQRGGFLIWAQLLPGPDGYEPFYHHDVAKENFLRFEKTPAEAVAFFTNGGRPYLDKLSALAKERIRLYQEGNEQLPDAVAAIAALPRMLQPFKYQGDRYYRVFVAGNCSSRDYRGYADVRAVTDGQAPISVTLQLEGMTPEHAVHVLALYHKLKGEEGQAGE